MSEPSWKDMYYQEREALDAEIADLKRQLEERTEELNIARQAEKYNQDVPDQADASRREAWRQLDEARKDTERVRTVLPSATG